MRMHIVSPAKSIHKDQQKKGVELVRPRSKGALVYLVGLDCHLGITPHFYDPVILRAPHGEGITTQKAEWVE